MARKTVVSGCGIVGSVRARTTQHVFERMLAELAHRGPDASGVWASKDSSVLLGHRRLAIVGADERGNQPMTHDRVTLACNGEIYNYRELRDLLERLGHKFGSDCDVEVILHGYFEWGIDGTLSRLNGIFAFALYDAISKHLYLARDPIGVKPLVLCDTPGGGLLFASEVKALLRHPDVTPRPRLASIRGDLTQGLLSDKTPTWFEGITNMKPGTFMSVDCNTGYQRVHSYWNYASTLHGYSNEEQIVQSLADLLDDAVGMQMASDFGVSTTCSGGIDSVAVTLLASKKATAPLDVFVLDYVDEDGVTSPAKVDYAHARRALEGHGNVRLITVPISMKELIREDTIDSLIRAHDGAMPLDIRVLAFKELYAAIHQRGHRVVLTGQGADELWMGYYEDPIYTFWKRGAEDLSPSGLARSFFNRIPMGESAWNLEFLNAERVYDSVLSNLANNYHPEAHSDLINALSEFVTRTHFQTILHMDDKIAMQTSLEARVPWVDKRMVELAFRTPSWMKLKSDDPKQRSKHLVRRAVAGLVPEHVINRTKAPFPNPQSPYGPILAALLHENVDKIQRSTFMKELFSHSFLSGISQSKLSERDMFTVYSLWRFGHLYVG